VKTHVMMMGMSSMYGGVVVGCGVDGVSVYVHGEPEPDLAFLHHC